jgi:two-component system OmpR family response regulator
VGDQRVVDVHIGQIRKKIEVDTTQPAMIQTVRGWVTSLNRPPRRQKLSLGASA